MCANERCFAAQMKDLFRSIVRIIRANEMYRNIYAYQNTRQSLCRRIFRHFFAREIVIIFFLFSLKF